MIYVETSKNYDCKTLTFRSTNSLAAGRLKNEELRKYIVLNKIVLQFYVLHLQLYYSVVKNCKQVIFLDYISIHDLIKPHLHIPQGL